MFVQDGRPILQLPTKIISLAELEFTNDERSVRYGYVPKLRAVIEHIYMLDLQFLGGAITGHRVGIYQRGHGYEKVRRN